MPMPIYTARLLLGTILFATTLATLPGCASHSPRTSDAEVMSVASAALAVVEARRPTVTLVIKSDLLSRLYKPLALMRETLTEADIPSSETLDLPEGYFRVEAFQITGNSAVFSGRLGPLFKRQPGVISLACGTGFEINLERQADGKWKPTTTTLIVC